jgi:hypothetical protein
MALKVRHASGSATSDKCLRPDKANHFRDFDHRIAGSSEHEKPFFA